ncbi:MAG: 5'-nucleotidase C-terminal domain-containing protein [Treponema sp.]|jgi:2',3'-cyclic-nucleotide 2'-phosphodiesterase (5'-nucleotidase family)|nr:5'-nucleotidase C-terminal domain-containing protein [Treponema sp.]
MLKKKLAVTLAFLLTIGILAMFMAPACDTGTNPAPKPGPGTVVPTFPPFNPEEPETAWVDGDVTIDIYSFNDFHGTVDNSASASNPGAAKFATGVKQSMSGSEHSMLLAAGDNYQGSALSNYFEGEPVSKMMKELEVKYSAVGNHEWDWGADKFIKFVTDGDVAFLAANIFLKGTDKQPDFCHPYVIANRAGRRIGIVGLTTTATPGLVSASAVADYEFRAPGEWLKNLVTGLKTEKNCDAVIALTHMGASGSGSSVNGEAAGLATSNMGFDAIISGHSHSTVSGAANGVPVIQANCNGRNLGKLSLKFNGGGLVSVTPSTISISTSGAEDPTIAAMIAGYDALVAPIMNEVIGVFGNASSVGKNVWANQLVFDYIVRKAKEPGWKAGAGWENCVLIQNSGGWRSVTLGGATAPVTVGFMWTLMPFDNEIYLFELRGDYLMNLLRNRDALNTRNLGTPPVITNASGSGANWSITSSGEKIDPAKLYKVSMNDFMFTDGDYYGVEDLAVYNPATLIFGVPLRDGMIEQMKWRTANGETPPPPPLSETIGTLTGGPLVHEYVIKAANTRYVEDTALIHLINDAMLYYTKDRGVTLTGTAPLSATANAQPGDITAATLSSIYYYDNNTLCVVEMTGSQFKEWMEWAHWDNHRVNMKIGDLTVPYGGGVGYNFDQFKGLSYKVDLTKNRGQRIIEMKNPDGSAFDLAKTYNVAVNDHRVDYELSNGVIFAAGIIKVVARGIAGMHNVLADYIENEKGGEITNEFTPSWEFIMPGSGEAWYPSYRAKAVELLNNGTLSFGTGSTAITITDVEDYMPTGGDKPPAELYPPSKPPKYGPLTVDFEGSEWDGGAYATRTVNSGGFEWTVSGVGTPDANDRFTGTKSIRLRGNTGADAPPNENRVELMDYLTNGIKSVSFDYASYSSHSGGIITLYYHVKGSSSWVNAGSVTAPAWDGAMVNKTFTINATGETRFKIVKSSQSGSTSVNVDNIEVTCEE